MNKAYQKLNFVNNQAPDLDAENMNSISTAIDMIDDRVVNQEGRLATAEGTIAHYPEELASKLDKNNPSGTGTLTIGEVHANNVTADSIGGILTNDTKVTFNSGQTYKLGNGIEQLLNRTSQVERDLYTASQNLQRLDENKLDSYNPNVIGVLTVNENAEIGTVKADDIKTSSLEVNNISGKNGNDIIVDSNMSIVYNDASYNIGRSISKLEALTTNQVTSASTSPLKNTLYTDIVGIMLGGKTTQAQGTPTQASPKEFTDVSPLVEVIDPDSENTSSKVYGFRSDILHDNVVGGEIIFNKFYDASGNLQEGSYTECVVYINLEYNQWDFIAYNVEKMSNRGWVWLDSGYRVVSVALNRNNADGTPIMLKRPNMVSVLGISLTIHEIADIRTNEVPFAIGLYHNLPLRSIDNLRDEIRVIRENEGQYLAYYEQNIYETVFDGTEADSNYTFVNGNPCSVTATLSMFGGEPVVCNAFTKGTGKDHFSINAKLSQITFYINQTSLSDFKAYLRQHPVSVRYKKLQTSGRHDLDDRELSNILSLRLNDGETIVRCNADWEISYPIDMKTYSDNEDAKLKEDIGDNAKAIEELKARPSGATAYYSKTSASPLAESIQYGILGINARGNSKQSGTPTPSAPIPIVDASGVVEAIEKNLFDKNNFTMRILNADGTITSNANVRCSDYIKASPFVLSYTANGSSSGMRIGFFDKDKNFLFRGTSTAKGNVTIKSTDLYTSPFEYVMISFDSTQTDSYFENIQIEQGTTPTEYEPYKSNTIEIPYTLRSVGNVKDEIIVNEDGSGQYIKRVGTVLTSALTWGDGSTFWESTSLSNVVKRPSSASKLPNVLCGALSKRIASGISTVGKGTNYIAVGTSGGSIYSTSSDNPKNWNNVHIYYELATPEIIDLTIDQMNNIKKLMTYKGTTIISSELEIPSVTYAADFMEYIDEADNKMESEIAEIKSRPSFTNESTSPLNASTNNNIVGLYAEGNSTQAEGTPSPTNPIPIKDASGVVEAHTKNILHYAEITSKTSGGVTATTKADGTLTLNGTQNGQIAIGFNLEPIAVNGRYSLSGYGDDALVQLYYKDASGTTKAIRFDSGVGVEIVGTLYQVFVYKSSGSTLTFNNRVLKLQVEEGTTASEYVEYKRNATYLDNGNLLDENASGWERGQYVDGVWKSMDTRVTTNFISIYGGTYTMSLKDKSNNNSFININYFDINKKWLGNRATLGLPDFGGTKEDRTFTLPSNAKYLRISYRAYSSGTAELTFDEVKNSKPMLEHGDKSSPNYISYADSMHIDLRSIGNIADTLTVNEDGSAEWVQKVGVRDLATLNWTFGWSTAWYTDNITDGVAPSIESIADIISDCYVAKSMSPSPGSSRVGEMGYWASSETKRLACNNGSSTTKPSGILYYELATPIHHTLTKEQVDAIRQLKTYEGTTLIDAELQSVKVKYQGDIKGYIDSKFDTLYALIRQYHPDVMALADGIAELSEVIENE